MAGERASWHCHGSGSHHPVFVYQAGGAAEYDHANRDSEKAPLCRWSLRDRRCNSWPSPMHRSNHQAVIFGSVSRIWDSSRQRSISATRHHSMVAEPIRLPCNTEQGSTNADFRDLLYAPTMVRPGAQILM